MSLYADYDNATSVVIEGGGATGVGEESATLVAGRVWNRVSVLLVENMPLPEETGYGITLVPLLFLM